MDRNQRRIDLRETITEASDRRALRRFDAEPTPLTGFSGLDEYRPLLPTESLPERMAAVWNLDYTPEELAIQQQEAREELEAREREDRQEQQAERELARGIRYGFGGSQ